MLTSLKITSHHFGSNKNLVTFVKKMLFQICIMQFSLVLLSWHLIWFLTLLYQKNWFKLNQSILNGSLSLNFSRYNLISDLNSEKSKILVRLGLDT